MKPIETGVDPKCNSAANSDAKFLMEVSGTTDTEEEVCPHRLKTPASPYQASQISGTSIQPSTILEKFKILQSRHNIMLVEGIGGLLVPITTHYNVADLAREMATPSHHRQSHSSRNFEPYSAHHQRGAPAWIKNKGSYFEQAGGWRS